MDAPETFTAFAGHRQVASGDLLTVAGAVSSLADEPNPILIFNDATGEPVELDLRHGPERAVADREARMTPPEPPRQRGRPKLGVVAREVTLLPRHWDWLATQRGGASAALRRLVEEAQRDSGSADRARQAQGALYRAMSILAGNLPGYEEATRALFAHDDLAFDALIAAWPTDVADYIARLATAERQARAAA